MYVHFYVDAYDTYMHVTSGISALLLEEGCVFLGGSCCREKKQRKRKCEM
jgi:hypothetical protein